MPQIVGKAVTVVDHDGLVIRECAGNVATKDDTLSIASVTVAQPTSEPWLTLDYDEWLVVTKGCIELHHHSEENKPTTTTAAGETDKKSFTTTTTTTVQAGETAFVKRGERFRPVFPVADTEYIAVCLPAFKPDRCQREEGEGVTSDVSKELQRLHKHDGKQQPQQPSLSSTDMIKEKYKDVDVLYHMCQQELWDTALRDKVPYFPPTFEKDGMFTHATAVPERLIRTANHFYKSNTETWICLELSRAALYKLGIATVFEEAKPVGETDVGQSWTDWVCPHIFGGIPTTIAGVVTCRYDMKRDPSDGTFLSIVGLTDK